jgi:CxxC motif-containing protein
MWLRRNNMAKKTITCIICPLGCDITVEGEGENIQSMTGQGCKRGEEYARNEFIHPLRILTSTVKVSGSKIPLAAVRTNKPMPQELLFQAMDEIRKVEARVPVKRGDVIIANILGTGVDIIATGEAV